MTKLGTTNTDPAISSFSTQAAESVQTQLVKYFKFLDELRDSGRTNMFGSPTFLQRRFRLSGDRATEVVKQWMRTFDRETPAAERARRATAAASLQKDDATSATEERAS